MDDSTSQGSEGIEPQSSELKENPSQGFSKKKSWLKPTVIVAIVLLVAGSWVYQNYEVLRFGWGFFRFIAESETHEERYGEIDAILKKIDYESAGTIIEENYDGRRHPLTPASFEATIEGEDSFQILKDRILDLPIECGASDKTVSCVMKNPSIDLFRKSNNITTLVLND